MNKRYMGRVTATVDVRYCVFCVLFISLVLPVALSQELSSVAVSASLENCSVKSAIRARVGGVSSTILGAGMLSQVVGPTEKSMFYDNQFSDVSDLGPLKAKMMRSSSGGIVREIDALFETRNVPKRNIRALSQEGTRSNGLRPISMGLIRMKVNLSTSKFPALGEFPDSTRGRGVLSPRLYTHVNIFEFKPYILGLAPGFGVHPLLNPSYAVSAPVLVTAATQGLVGQQPTFQAGGIDGEGQTINSLKNSLSGSRLSNALTTKVSNGLTDDQLK